MDFGFNPVVFGVCCAFVLCGVGFGVWCMCRYLHFSFVWAAAISSAVNLALLALVLSLQSYESAPLDVYHIFQILMIYLVLSVFFVMAYLDYVYLALPDSVLMVFFVLGCACVVSIAMPASSIWVHMSDALVLMGGAFVVRFFGEVISQKPMLGEADIIVFGGIGLVFGVLFALLSVFVASCLALVVALVRFIVYRTRTQAIAFVSYLFVGVLISYVGDLGNLAQIALYNGAWNV
ncbi:prepilin peptidase [uncultured Helicobacter sp.]|uniref:prepilin peptidase n=1 Tax=uncultured Helicobacter sp. TaxID=175537 RepID=UPI00374FC712